MSYGARALIQLDALQHNLQVIRDTAPGTCVMAVVKANAYGHGLLTVAQALCDVDSIAVARLVEARALRDAGIDKPIVLLEGIMTDAELSEAIHQDFELVVHCPEQLSLLARGNSGKAIVWLKFDTGMNRLGFDVELAPELIGRLQAMRSVAELRLMTHLACGDDVGSPMTRRQVDEFRSLSASFSGAVSIANSPAIFGDLRASLDDLAPASAGPVWIRPGLALLGISPFAKCTGPDLGLRPVMRFESRLIAIKPIRAGAHVGYGGRFQMANDSMLGIVAAGYGDGYTRHFRDGTPVLINGRRVPLAGAVSMDMMAVDLGPDSRDAVGDVATLWGEGLPVEEVAPWADAIPYELVCGVMHREASVIVGYEAKKPILTPAS